MQRQSPGRNDCGGFYEGLGSEYDILESAKSVISNQEGMMETQQLNQFDEILESLGGQSAQFFLAASLYHAKKVSFQRAAELAGLSFSDFTSRLKEHFDTGFVLFDEVVEDDLDNVKKIFEAS